MFATYSVLLVYYFSLPFMSKIKSLLYVPNSADSTAWGLLILRIGLAFLMVRHGYDKMLTLTSGNPIDFPDPLGVGPATSLVLTVFAELVCSAMLFLGLFTRFAASTLAICMLVIVFRVHWSDPLGDKEHALLYLFGYIALLMAGPGKFALDDRLA
jgi:putative oxidoreductase